MRSRVAEAIERVSDNGWIGELQSLQTLEERYQRLFELLPEIPNCSNLIIRNQMLFHVHTVFGIDLGVCNLYGVDEHRQYCHYNGMTNECNCLIPQLKCVLRDGDDEGDESDEDEGSEYPSIFC